jgi:hypothetical protein
MADKWVEVRDDLLFFFIFHLLFLIRLTSGSMSMSVHIEPAQHLHVGPTYQIRCQFAFNSRSVRIAKKFPESRGFLRLKRKVVVF